ncbi:hypothetical protein FRC01_007709 [Tulasnella sp. 417]|nr:hypothetical protein FRC01_007709 [Tulasnella sp. 417]
MADSSFIYVDSSPEPETLPYLSASTTAKGKGKARARPPPMDEDIIVISDDDDSRPLATRIQAEYGVPGPSSTSPKRAATHSQVLVRRAPSAYLQGNGPTRGESAAATRDQSPIPQWVIDDLTTIDAVAGPSSLNHNQTRSSPRTFPQPSTIGNNRSVSFNESPPPMDAFEAQLGEAKGDAPLAPEDRVAAYIKVDGIQPDDIMPASLRIPPRPSGSASSGLPLQDPLPSHSSHSEEERDAANIVEDIASTHLASVLAVIPDVQPEHAAALIHEQLTSGVAANAAVEVVINQLFDTAYPKVEKKKRKRDTEGSMDGSNDIRDRATGSTKDQKKGRIDWLSLERAIPGGPYVILALDQLSQDFRYVAKSHVRDVFSSNKSLYYPSYFQLRKIDNTSPFWKKVPTPRPRGKGHFKSEEFESERKAVLDVVAAEQEPGRNSGDQAPGPSNSKQSDQSEGDEEVEGGIECGCCFAEYAFENMVQCPEAHLFCKTCARRTAEEAIGARKAVIKCMDQDGCQLEFAASEIRRFLDTKAFDLLEKIKAERAVTDACLEGLEECPFCDFKCIIENDQERLFRCENDECGIDHLPKTCAEVVDDRNLDARHAVEEAMTEALMRKGYDHFNEQPRGGPPSKKKGKKDKCPLWDDLEKRHHDEVAEAARRAAREQELANPEVNPEQLKVDLPPVASQPAQNVAPVQQPPIPVRFGGGFNFNPLALLPNFAGIDPVDQVRNDPVRLDQRAQQGRQNALEQRPADREELLARVQQQDAALRRAQENLERQRNHILALQQARGPIMGPFGGLDNNPPLGFGGMQRNAIFGEGAQHQPLPLFGNPPIPNPPDRQGNPFMVQQGWFGPGPPVIGHAFDNAGPQPAQPR